MSANLPPPPVNVTNTREMYTWLYRLYAYVTGEVGGQVVDGETLIAVGAFTQAAVAEQQKELQGVPLLAQPYGSGEFAKELQSVQLAQLQSRVSELQKQVDALILYATRPPQGDKFQDAVLMSGARKT